jgi:hypothetical protein
MPGDVRHASRVVGMTLRQYDKGAGVFVTVNETTGSGRHSDQIVRIRATWAEDDDGYTGAFPLEPSIIVETSPGHRHVYWLVRDGWLADEQGRRDFDGVMARMVTDYGSDPAAKDISRVLRVPGFRLTLCISLRRAESGIPEQKFSPLSLRFSGSTRPLSPTAMPSPGMPCWRTSSAYAMR